jgi:hypothetical protein
VAVLLAVSAIFYSPSVGNKDGPASKAQLHSTKFISHLTSTARPGDIQLATAETTVSFERPATKSTRLIPEPLRKVNYYASIVVRNNGPPAA